MITGAGTGWAFLANGLSFAAPITGLLLTGERARELHVIERARRAARASCGEGLRYVARRPELIWPIVLVGFIGHLRLQLPGWLSAYADDISTPVPAPTALF